MVVVYDGLQKQWFQEGIFSIALAGGLVVWGLFELVVQECLVVCVENVYQCIYINSLVLGKVRYSEVVLVSFKFCFQDFKFLEFVQT